MADKDSIDINPSDTINVIGSTEAYHTLNSDTAYQESAKTTNVDASVFKNVSLELLKDINSENNACKHTHHDMILESLICK